ncbi:unnamed protein product [Notodromas monacha]|uniref:Major facilitator superfamily associated domain-containing protein n=1 Tax=Notodromas monacha TaxID=399045 RepID=A0A7R9GFE4_9CRUS|nr:unnamed protein product [Notodromas monacha]CAG0919056.1 unnamed protein product [Notodromas monacha]
MSMLVNENMYGSSPYAQEDYGAPQQGMAAQPIPGLRPRVDPNAAGDVDLNLYPEAKDSTKKVRGRTDIIEMLFGNMSQELLMAKTFYFFFFSAFGSLFPLMGVYFKQLGLNPVQCGLLSGLRPLVEYIAVPFWVGVAERILRSVLIRVDFSYHAISAARKAAASVAKETRGLAINLRHMISIGAGFQLAHELKLEFELLLNSPDVGSNDVRLRRLIITVLVDLELEELILRRHTLEFSFEVIRPALFVTNCGQFCLGCLELLLECLRVFCSLAKGSGSLFHLADSCVDVLLVIPTVVVEEEEEASFSSSSSSAVLKLSESESSPKNSIEENVKLRFVGIFGEVSVVRHRRLGFPCSGESENFRMSSIDFEVVEPDFTGRRL